MWLCGELCGYLCGYVGSYVASRVRWLLVRLGSEVTAPGWVLEWLRLLCSVLRWLLLLGSGVAAPAV